MAQDTADGPYGPGCYIDEEFTPLPQECKRLLHELARKTPGFTQDASLIDGVQFTGSDVPCVAGPIKTQAFVAVLHAMVGIVGHEILSLKGIKSDQKTIIDTDQAGLFLATPALVRVDGVEGAPVMQLSTLPDYNKNILDSAVKVRSEAIYETNTKDVWYQLHGSTAPDGVLRAIGVDPESSIQSNDQAYEHINEHMKNYSARDLEMIMVEKGFAGSVVNSPAGWLETSMGKSLSRHPVINYCAQNQTPKLKPTEFPSVQSKDQRPLAGIKVIEFARIIAGPACGAILSSMGAEVIRIQAGRMMDLSALQLTLTAGKRTYDLDLTNEVDHKTVVDLISTADVILQGYRIKSLERRGLGLDACLEIANKHERGIIYLDENCYGPDGYFAERPGWQQVADAAAGSSYVMGKSYGYPDGHGVLPSLPISDLATGVISAVDIMLMLRDRAKFGGSYHGTASLVAFNAATLQPWVRLYSPETVARIEDKFHFPRETSDQHVLELLLVVFEAWKKAGDRGGSLIDDEKRYTHFENSVFGKDLRILAPLVRYSDDKTTPKWSSPPVPFCHYHEKPDWNVSLT